MPSEKHLTTQHNTALDDISPTNSIVKRLVSGLIKAVIFLSLMISAIWLGLLIWFHFSDNPLLSLIYGAAVLSTASLGVVSYVRRRPYWFKFLGGYMALLLAAATWFMLLPAKQDRDWQPEVARSLSVTRDAANPHIVTLHNVRDFSWRRSDGADVSVQDNHPMFQKLANDSEGIEIVEPRWHSRTIDLNQLNGVDVINSYWMGPQIAHTLISFRFEDDRPLTFSLEIRKEEGESFSALGGFFRRYEMSLIAAEERDIVYTRSNVRGEQVYIFPVRGVTNHEVRGLFESYLKKAASLQADAQWYNTLTSNCTNIIFEMARHVSDGRLPIDYRIWMSGYLPQYLYEINLLPHTSTRTANDRELAGNKMQKEELDGPWTIESWYEHAYINPKVSDIGLQDIEKSPIYSQRIRQGLPLPTVTPLPAQVNEPGISALERLDVVKESLN